MIEWLNTLEMYLSLRCVLFFCFLLSCCHFVCLSSTDTIQLFGVLFKTGLFFFLSVFLNSFFFSWIMSVSLLFFFLLYPFCILFLQNSFLLSLFLTFFFHLRKKEKKKEKTKTVRWCFPGSKCGDITVYLQSFIWWSLLSGSTSAVQVLQHYGRYYCHCQIIVF